MSFRIGQGFDVHRVSDGPVLHLCGLAIECGLSLEGHSDADVALHALTDALLGALAAGDIGEHFPPSEARWRGASSDLFVEYACQRARDEGWQLANCDLTIIGERPKIGPYRTELRQSLARILETDLSSVSVKATTTERLGFTGRGEGLAAMAVVLLVR